jgi:hypothetical protein
MKRPHGSRGLRARLRATLSLVLVLGTLASPAALPSRSSAFTTTTIAIDGDFSDWIGVRADPDNVVRDTQIPDDPDWPGQPDRDVYIVATTYDSEYLYFSWRRTAGGTKAITFGAYLDYEGNGLLQDTDKVVMWTVSTGGPYASWDNGSAWILDYNQARNKNGSFYHPEGDPMRDTHRTGSPTGDGETPDGWAVWQDGYTVPAKTMDGYLSPAGDGIECEARIAWSDLGVAAGHPFAIHFAAGNGEAWGTKDKISDTYKEIGGGRYLEENRGQVEDNIEPIMYLLDRGVTVSPDNAGGGAAGSTVTYTHTIANDGNTAGTFDLSALSARGWTVLLTDGSGTPIPPYVTLAPGATTTVQVRVLIPPGTADGTQDVTTLTAVSRTDPGVTDTATDTTRVGQVTVTPNQSATMAPGQTVEYEFVVQNNLTGYREFDLSAVSSLGWPYSIVDGNGLPLSAVGLESGGSTTVRLLVQVPASATPGTQDVTRLTAALVGSPSVASSATGATTVADGLAITPDNSGYAGAGTFVQYAHAVTNSWPETRTVTLSASSSAGWPVTFWAADGVTPITQVTVGPNGAGEQVLVRIAVPSGATTGATDTTTITATTVGAGGATVSDTAVDTTTVRRLTTYADGGYVNQTDEYVLGDLAYARATGLRPNDDVYFVWKDATGTIVRTSSTRRVDTQGMAFDEYSTLESDPPGHWVVELYTSGGTLLERAPFTVTYDAEITALSATDAPGVGEQVAVTSSVVNRNTSPVTDSAMTYVIWWDTDGDGSFGAGDIYIDDAGSPVTWDGISPVTPSHVTTGIDVVGGGTWTEPGPWTVANTDFPNQGTYRVTARWTSSAGLLIDEATTEFYSIPTLGWPLFGLTIAGAMFMLWRRRDAIGGEPA